MSNKTELLRLISEARHRYNTSDIIGTLASVRLALQITERNPAVQEAAMERDIQTNLSYPIRPIAHWLMLAEARLNYEAGLGVIAVVPVHIALGAAQAWAERL